MVRAKITSKGQLTIPKKLREELNLNPGDRVEFNKVDDELRLRKVGPFDEAYHSSVEQTLNEWLSEEDEQAYAEL